MKQNETYEDILKSAEDVEVPEELQPESIENMLQQELRQEETGAVEKKVEPNVIRMGQRQKFHWKKSYTALVAAAMAAIVLIPAVALPGLNNDGMVTTSQVTEPEPAIEVPEQKATLTASVGDFGETLRHPDSYEEVYNSAKEYAEQYYFVDEGLYGVEAATEAENTGGLFDSFNKKEATTEESAAVYEDTTAATGDYSKTNTREEDVSEGDITITDGTYIYHYDPSEEDVIILGTKNGELSKVATIAVNHGEDVQYIEDMYVVGKQLVVIGDTYHYHMNREGTKRHRLTSDYGIIALVYDISDASKPKEVGSTTYDGNYYSSRIVDGMLYVFTQQYPNYGLYETDEVWTEEQDYKTSGVIPYVNGEVAALDRIYLPSDYTGEPSFTMSSVDLKNPKKVVDYQVIMGYTSDIYVSNDAIYLQTVDYSADVNVTGIVRLNYAAGKFQPAGVGVVRGDLLDAYAIDEDADGNLRVATTAVSYNGGVSRSNRLTIFDSKMKEIGKLTGLAEGEEIKSARYIGDYCYLVTFENTDPLFTIDVSDPENPTLIGELKMPGFSEYLHPWGNGKLLGFGYNGNEYGRTEGLKLVMFDTSNSAEVAIIDERLIKHADESYALQDYKAILVSPERGLIGFVTRDWDETDAQYQLYRYTEDEFELLYTATLHGYYNEGSARGLFIGNAFYLVEEGEATSYDMDNSFKKISHITW